MNNTYMSLNERAQKGCLTEFEVDKLQELVALYADNKNPGEAMFMLDVLHRAKEGRLSSFEVIQLHEMVTMYLNRDVANYTITTLPKQADCYQAMLERTATYQYRFLSMAQTIKKTGLSRSTLERMEKEGTFPQRLTISEGRKGWHSKDVNLWMEAQEWATIIRNNPELDDEERKHMLKFCRIIRTNRLYKAAKRLPERPWGCYEPDDDEDE